MPKIVSEEYAELMHYTTVEGLTGIVSNDCLWASNYEFLNDTKEIEHFFDVRLGELVSRQVSKYENELKLAPENAKSVAADGGFDNVVRLDADDLTEILRKVTLKFNNPYIFSMSATADPLVAQNGLLSQWRGYGSDGGYAIVFDTAELERLLKSEVETYHYQHVQLADAHYHGIEFVNKPVACEVLEWEAELSAGIARFIRESSAVEIEDCFDAISSLSFLYKHWGFSEEHEVRVVAIPADREVARLTEAKGETRLPRPIKTFLRGGLPVPYLDLFARSSAEQGRVHLPIKKVIVGPHREGAIRKQAVQLLLAANGYEAEVVRSEIPYIGR